MPKTEPQPMTREEFQRAGYKVDNTVYPWVAYKGPRFQPQEFKTCLTDLEAKLYRMAENHDRDTALQVIEDHLGHG